MSYQQVYDLTNCHTNNIKCHKRLKDKCRSTYSNKCHISVNFIFKEYMVFAVVGFLLMFILFVYFLLCFVVFVLVCCFCFVYF